MALRDWLAPKVATATLATPATLGTGGRGAVATVATVAVATPANDEAQIVATPEQEAELRDLVGIVATDWPEADRAEALAVALADPVAALTCWRALSDEQAVNSK